MLLHPRPSPRAWRSAPVHGPLHVVRDPEAAAPHDLLLDPAFPYGEDLLQFIWEAQLFDRHSLRTVDGRPVEVLHPGRIQRDAGPDLRDARLRIGGLEWAGTVEVHVRSSEWARHGHQHDPAYESVALHVVYEHDAEARTLGGRVLPTVELLPRVSTASLSLFAGLLRGRGAVPCAAHLPPAEPERLNTWLETVLVERLIRRTAAAEELHGLLQRDSAALAWHLLCRAFGQRANAEPFAMLAHALPWSVLRRVRDDAFRVEALVFGQAGLLQVDFVDEHPRRLQTEHRALARLHGLRPAPVAAWTFGRLRPAAFPTVRLAQLAALVARLSGELTDLAAAPDVPALRRLLQAAPAPYWTTHYRFDHATPPRPKPLGAATVDQLIINAVVPLLFVLGRTRGDQALRDRAIALLEQLPPEHNTVLAQWTGRGVAVDSAARGQALLELQRQYCTPRRCLSCGFGRHLLRGTRP